MGRRVRATKGSSSTMRTPLLFSKVEINRAGKASKFGLELVRLDTDHWKSWVHERIRWREDKPGAWNLPRGVDDDYCHQVVGEARIVAPNGRPSWIERGRHHDYLDCEAMQAAGGYLLNVQRIPLAPLQKIGNALIADDGRQPQTPSENIPTPSPNVPRAALARRVRRISRSNFLG
jgi:phage terminase large subunit GpA-like protein